jgi:hypothetical protein
MASASQDRCLLVATRSKQGIYTVFNIFQLGGREALRRGARKSEKHHGSGNTSSGHGRSQVRIYGNAADLQAEERLDVLDTSWSRSCMHSFNEPYKLNEYHDVGHLATPRACQRLPTSFPKLPRPVLKPLQALLTHAGPDIHQARLEVLYRNWLYLIHWSIQ